MSLKIKPTCYCKNRGSISITVTVVLKYISKLIIQYFTISILK
jgi:hypothetical protein